MAIADRGESLGLGTAVAFWLLLWRLLLFVPFRWRPAPEWQDLTVGDQLRSWSPGGLLAPWEVAALEPDRFLGLHKLTDLRGRSLDRRQPRPSAYMEGLRGFQLNELPAGHSRLVIGGYQAIQPRWLERVVFGWSNVVVVWIMQARMLAALKRNIEQAANAPAPPVAEPAPAGRR